MKVFKFGGASVNATAVQNVAGILREFAHEPTLVVVSAMGKTTNALEKIAHAHYHNDAETKQILYKEVKQFHFVFLREFLFLLLCQTFQRVL